ncbi:uncharacterized protein LOC124417784 isoform X2 [Gallus gallus]|uniref:uncharacterized protein LOC124417784 isoform X2 n=1 Tax=Gallus gallus TaxID=9031 RepID=UPI001EFFBF44|nr:uncharacterized protein LOC124417784 isoform X2 [Gallus gallus]XP_046789647.1 uncharacterized protein LOC124417784 isoform X2 [Gallus gallus]
MQSLTFVQRRAIGWGRSSRPVASLQPCASLSLLQTGMPFQSLFRCLRQESPEIPCGCGERGTDSRPGREQRTKNHLYCRCLQPFIPAQQQLGHKEPDASCLHPAQVTAKLVYSLVRTSWGGGRLRCAPRFLGRTPLPLLITAGIDKDHLLADQSSFRRSGSVVPQG